jgi:hypothetical protein
MIIDLLAGDGRARGSSSLRKDTVPQEDTGGKGGGAMTLLVTTLADPSVVVGIVANEAGTSASGEAPVGTPPTTRFPFALKASLLMNSLK